MQMGRKKDEVVTLGDRKRRNCKLRNQTLVSNGKQEGRVKEMKTLGGEDEAQNLNSHGAFPVSDNLWLNCGSPPNSNVSRIAISTPPLLKLIGHKWLLIAARHSTYHDQNNLLWLRKSEN